MKKSIGFISFSLLLCLTLLFVGCGNTNKSLAKNLDNTVTNLIYSVSSLDWADSSILSNISGNTNSTYDSSLNYFNNYDYDYNNYAELNDINDINYNLQSNQYNDYNYNINNRNINFDQTKNNIYDNYYEDDSKFENTTQLNNLNKSRRNNGYSITYFENKKIQRRNNLIQNNYNKQFLNDDNSNANLNSNMSGFNPNRQRFSKNLVSEIKTDPQTTIQTTPYKMVNFSTTNIEDNSNLIQDRITELLNKRSTVLLNINDLYKGNVNLTESTITAINAYINIIKDNTSFLNKSKGLIVNQLSRAHKLASQDQNSPLINAYIIRTNEAIESRISKLDSSILAIDSICEILSSNSTNNTKIYNNYTENTNSNLLNNTNKKLNINNNSANYYNYNKNSYQNTLNNETKLNNTNNLNRENNNKNQQIKTLDNTYLNNNTNHPINQTKNICIDCEDCKTLDNCTDCKNCRIVKDCSECKNDEICIKCNPNDPNNCTVCIPKSQTNNDIPTKTIKNNQINNANAIPQKNNIQKTIKSSDLINKKQNNQVKQTEKTVSTFSNFLDKKHREKEELLKTSSNKTNLIYNHNKNFNSIQNKI